MPLVLSENRGPVRHIVLNRPERRNALNLELVRDLHSALDEAAGDPGVSCLVLRGAGPMFSSGMDLDELAPLAAAPERLAPFRRECLAAWALCAAMPQPVVAELHGRCVGGALELALACDLRVVAEETLLGLPETRIGLVPDLGGCARLGALVGLGRAKHLVLTGRLITGAEAERIGLATRAVPAEGLSVATAELVEELLVCSPPALVQAKRILEHAAVPILAASLDHEGAAQEVCVRTEEFAGRVRDYLAARTARHRPPAEHPAPSPGPETREPRTS